MPTSSDSRGKSQGESGEAGAAPAAGADLLARVTELREEIDRHNYAYYVLDEPLVDDSVYDGLMRELEALEAKHPSLRSEDSPTARVGVLPPRRRSPPRIRPSRSTVGRGAAR